MGTVSVIRKLEQPRPWVEMAACDHVVQIYGSDAVFLDGLESFVAHGLRAGEGVVVIATAMHLHGLEARLRTAGIDVELAKAESRYVARLAEDLLVSFMRGEWPDETGF